MSAPTPPRLLLVGLTMTGLTLALLVGCGFSPNTAAVPAPEAQAPVVMAPAVGAPVSGPVVGTPVPVTPGPVVVAPAPPPVVLNTEGQAVNTPTSSYPYAVTLTINGTDDAAALQKAYDARMISWQTAEGFALLATRSDQLPNDPAHAPVLEKNADTISGGGGMTAKISGSSRLWATGSISAWSSGSSRLWATGQFAPVPENTNLWKQVHLEQAQTSAPKLGAGVKVAIIDTGIDPGHPAFVGALAPKNEWHDFYDDDADPTDVGVLGQGGYGHGSSTAGIVLQIAPKATILPLRALGPDGGGDVLSIARAIDWAVARGANIINLSLGSTERSRAIQDAISRANRVGVLVTASAGNENKDMLDYPAADASKSYGTLSVGSVSGSDVKSGFSNYGSTLELTAPGEEVFGPAPGQNAQGGWNMAAWSGTSMSAPMAAGALALQLAQGGGQRSVIVSALLTARMLDTSVDTDKINGNKPYKKLLGQGRLDIGRFVAGDNSKGKD